VRLRIHHGAAQVGGNCIELVSEGKSLLLDLGLPLDSAPIMPPVAGLTSPDPSLLGVVISHPHLDHYGLLQQARPGLPVWLGEGAQRLLQAATPFTGGAALPQTITPYQAGSPFDVGPFRITAYLMDHSAYDAHALLVEAGGKRLFYTGDFRGHGRKSVVFERFLRSPPADVDVLLMEGTTLGRADEAPVSERDVEDRACALMREQPGVVLACLSGQNIDRFVTFLRASMRAGRTFVIDAYMANLIGALNLKGLPNVLSHPGVRIYLPKGQKRMIINSQRFDLIEPFAERRVYMTELMARPQSFTLMFRASMLPDLAGQNLHGGACIYSLWPGYLERDRTDLRQWSKDNGVDFQIIHSSGHAHRQDLMRMAKAVNPKRLIPIHTAHPDDFGALFERVQRVDNGEWAAV